MKVEWLNAEMRMAILTRGFWRWRRVAVVSRELLGDWKYIPSGDVVESEIVSRIERSYWGIFRKRIDRERQERNWTPTETLPRARLVERNP